MAVKAGRAHAFHGDGEAIGWRQRRHQGSLQLGLREELLPVLQVGRVHLEEGRAARVAWLQHGCPPAAERTEDRQKTSGDKRGKFDSHLRHFHSNTETKLKEIS